MSSDDIDKGNCSTVSDFILVGLSDLSELSLFLFLVFRLIYGVTVMGNIGMITVIEASSQLHTPMYFFLSHLPFVDFCYSTTIVPKMLANVLEKEKAISFLACTVQFYLFCTCVVTEIILLAVMVYDYFVTICYPLLYMVIMSQKVCLGLVSACYICGTAYSLIHIWLALQIKSYRSNAISHFFFDLPTLLSLACSDVSMNELLLFIVASFNEIITILTIVTSYLFILITILMRCASHLTAIIVFHGTILSIYCKPNSDYSLEIDKVAMVFYTAVIPMVNPLIYSLRNKDVKTALWKLLSYELSF